MTNSLLLRSLVRPFFRQNSGFFFFLFFVFFGAVAPSTQLAYHYSLILGMLETPVFMGIVLLAWLLYAGKCSRWVVAELQSPELSFLNLLSRRRRVQQFLSWLLVQHLLLLPVSFYALAVTGVALYRGATLVAVGIPIYIILLGLAGARRYQHAVENPGERSNVRRTAIRWFPLGARVAPPYWTFFLRYLLHANKALLLGLQFFASALLYLLLKDPDPARYDIRMPYLVFSLALFGHGILIYRCRELEEKRLVFYRGLPVSLRRRFFQLAWLYFVLLLPEMLTLYWLAPACIHWRDAVGFLLSGYSLLLLLHSLLTATWLSMSAFLRVNLLLFGILYWGVLGGGLIVLSGSFFVLAGGRFWMGYWAKNLFHFQYRKV